MTDVLDWIGQQLAALLDALSYRIIGPLALLLAAAPFYPEPHLVETSRMLVRGELTEPIYIFDFLMHSSGLVLVGAKIVRDVLRDEDEHDEDEKRDVVTDVGRSK